MYLDNLDELDQKIIQLLIENARISYSDIGKETGKKNHQTGIQGKFLANKTEPDINRNSIQNHIDQRIGNCHMKKHLGNTLDQDRQAGCPAWIKTSCPDKRFDIECHQK